jgi:DNA polymerase I
MKGFIVDRTYRLIDGKAYVYLFGRLADGSSFLTINQFRPYFFIKTADLEKAKKIASFDDEKVELQNMSEEPVVKVILDVPKDVAQVRQAFENQGIPCYEADIRFTQRFLMERGIYATLDIHGEHKKGHYVDRIYENPELTAVDFTPKLETLSFDIETSLDGNALFSISLVQGERRTVLFLKSEEHAPFEMEHVEQFESEKALLERFSAVVQEWDPDIITGWNCIDFDLADLKRRFDKHKVPFRLGRADWECSLRIESSFVRDSTADFPGRMVLDGIHLMKSSFIRLDDYKLETAATEFLGEGKLVKGDDRHGEIERLYWKSPKELIAYNLKDSELVLQLLEKVQLIELTILRSMLTGLTMERVRASIASFDSVYIRHMNKAGIVAPTGSYTDTGERITGGFVKDSKPGIYEFILVLDFKSMYPSVIRSFNIDPVSYLPDCTEKKTTKEIVVAPNGACFKNEQGLLPGIIHHLWEERDKAKKRKDQVASLAIKTLMNSFFGVLASPNCRFFSLEMGNAITHFARMFIKLAAEKIEEQGYDVIYGDSITAERPIIIRKNGLISFVTIEDLFTRFEKKKVMKGTKEVISNPRIETLSFNLATQKACFRPVNEIIRHAVNKQIYRVNQKYGETRCTEDHSLIRAGDLQEIRPTEIEGPLATLSTLPALKAIQKIDLVAYLQSYSHQTMYKGREKTLSLKYDDQHVWFSWTQRKKPVLLRRYIDFPSVEGDALLQLLGFYVAEGSSSTPETTSSRWGATLSGTKEDMETYKKLYAVLFSNTTTTVIPTQKGKRILRYTTDSGRKKISYYDTTHKLNMMNMLAAVFFKQLCGQKSTGKKIPDFLYHLPKKEKEKFLAAYLAGDGSRERKAVYSSSYRKKHFRATTRSTMLASGLTFLLKQLGFSLSIRYRPSKKVYTIASSDKNNTRLTTNVVQEEYSGYVYDLAVEGTHLFADGCGQVLLHNTDSVFVHSKAADVADAEKIGLAIQESINAFYEEYVSKEYFRKNFMELEAEKIYRKFMLPTVRGSDVGAKKRYAGLKVTKEGEKLDFTGLEFVRRDWTEVSKKFQLELIDKIFHEEEVTAYVKNFVDALKAGNYDDLLVYKKSIRKDLSEYTKTTPPHVKAARILEEKEGKVKSSIIEYVMTEHGPEPLTYTTAPIDYEHYIEKQIKPIADSVLGFYDTNFDDLVAGSSQKTLFGY